MNFKDIIEEEKKKDYFKELESFLKEEYQNKTIYPKYEDIYKAFDLTPIEQVKVVLIGQDPYFTPGLAMGLSFSVNDGVKIPKSLMNIYKEIKNELGLEIPKTGNLTNLAKKGVLLLNLILTVEEGKALSHQNKGWEIFTRRIIEELNKRDQKIVFLLFGSSARQISKYLNNPNHLVLETSHPSPLGAYKGFFGSGVFKKSIEFLGEKETFWRIEN